MSQVRCIRAALAGVVGAGLLAGSGLASAAALPPVSRLGPRGAPPGLPPLGPAPGWAALSVAVSPVLVPPLAPVDVTVSARGLAGQAVDVQVLGPSGWVVAAHTLLDASGSAAVRVARPAAGTYDVRAVWDSGLRAGEPRVSLASETDSFEVTARGLGDPRAYRYLYVARGAPARWDPCRPVTYRVNAAAGRATSLADLREALRRVSYETGVVFREVGTTEQVPGSAAFRYEADVVVAWVPGARSSELGRGRAAAGGFEAPVPGRGGRPRIRHGFVVVDADRVGALAAGFGAGVTEGQVLLHELGHLMGLAHVNAAEQVMRPAVEDMRASLYGAGDLTGLRRVGRSAGCV